MVTVVAELEKVVDEEVLGNERLLELLSPNSPQAVSKSKADVKRAAKILFNSIPSTRIDNKCQSCIIWFVEEIHIPVVSVHTDRLRWGPWAVFLCVFIAPLGCFQG